MSQSLSVFSGSSVKVSAEIVCNVFPICLILGFHHAYQGVGRIFASALLLDLDT